MKETPGTERWDLVSSWFGLFSLTSVHRWTAWKLTDCSEGMFVLTLRRRTWEQLELSSFPLSCSGHRLFYLNTSVCKSAENEPNEYLVNVKDLLKANATQSTQPQVLHMTLGEEEMAKFPFCLSVLTCVDLRTRGEVNLVGYCLRKRKERGEGYKHLAFS